MPSGTRRASRRQGEERGAFFGVGYPHKTTPQTSNFHFLTHFNPAWMLCVQKEGGTEVAAHEELDVGNVFSAIYPNYRPGKGAQGRKASAPLLVPPWLH